MPADWPFADPEDHAVLAFTRIVEGRAPIRLVTRDEADGSWQFGDGGEVASESEVARVGLGAVARLDPTVLALGDLPPGWAAWRESADGPWRRSRLDEDEVERTVRANVEAVGWHVMMIPDDDQGPGFAYSIGLLATFGHPEVIVLGLDLDAMHGIVNRIGSLIRSGLAFAPGGSSDDVLDGGHRVRFGPVARRHYPDHLGYAEWFHGTIDFPALQCLWPDMSGVFPDDPAAPESLRRRQPILSA